MDFIISSSKIKKGENAIILDSNTYSGIKKIAAKVALDLKAVFGAEPAVLENKTAKNPIYAGTVNDALIKDLGVDVSTIKDKREVYKIMVKNDALIIVGSDKRGTIYGLFKLSEMLGVSPLSTGLTLSPSK